MKNAPRPRGGEEGGRRREAAVPAIAAHTTSPPPAAAARYCAIVATSSSAEWAALHRRHQQQRRRATPQLGRRRRDARAKVSSHRRNSGRQWSANQPRKHLRRFLLKSILTAWDSGEDALADNRLRTRLGRRRWHHEPYREPQNRACPRKEPPWAGHPPQRRLESPPAVPVKAARRSAGRNVIAAQGPQARAGRPLPLVL